MTSERAEASKVPTDASGKAPSIATGDIAIEAIVQIGASFKDLHFEKGIRGEPVPDGGAEVSLQVDMQVLVEEATKRSALVRLAVTARPNIGALWEASAEYVAVYSVGDNPPLSLQEFAWSNGIANLVPFVRERIASLTQASNYPTYILPPISVARLRELHEQSAAARERSVPAAE